MKEFDKANKLTLRLLYERYECRAQLCYKLVSFERTMEQVSIEKILVDAIEKLGDLLKAREQDDA